MIEASDEKADGGYYSVICGLEHKTACFNKVAVAPPLPAAVVELV